MSPACASPTQGTRDSLLRPAFAPPAFVLRVTLTSCSVACDGSPAPPPPSCPSAMFSCVALAFTSSPCNRSLAYSRIDAVVVHVRRAAVAGSASERNALRMNNATMKPRSTVAAAAWTTRRSLCAFRCTCQRTPRPSPSVFV
jgi:hypothetical protein